MPNDTQRIEIITGCERRRRYTAHEKVRFVEETMQPGMIVSAVARIHGLSLLPCCVQRPFCACFGAGRRSAVDRRR